MDDPITEQHLARAASLLCGVIGQAGDDVEGRRLRVGGTGIIVYPYLAHYPTVTQLDVTAWKASN